MRELTVMGNKLWRWGTVFNDDGTVHYHRLPLIMLPWKLGTLYLHKFIHTDLHRPPHDHPKWFVSIGLKGYYTEEVYEPRQGTRGNGFGGRRMVSSTTYRAPWIRAFGAHHTHRLIIPTGRVTWTLVITGPRKRRWGYLQNDGVWIDAYDWTERHNQELPESVERFLLEAERRTG